MTRYKLLAVDLDGTLVGPDQCVSPSHAEAMRRARQAGLAVCLCTGRGPTEAVPAWRECNLPLPADPLIAIGGSIIVEADTGRTLHIEPIDPDAAVAVSAQCAEMGYAVVGLVDRWRWGFDYVLTEVGNHRQIWRDWFAKHDCEVRTVPALNRQADLPDLLRLTLLVEPADAPAVEARIRQRWQDRLEIISILAPNYGIHVIELHAAGATKWSGIQYVAGGLGVGARDVVAVGDDLNDLPMITRAGLGVAMGNAAPSVRVAARHTIGRHDEDGLADFVRHLVEGRYD